MKRRVIKQGHNTLTVTLPSEWVKKLNINAGDELDIIEKENSLLINGNEKPLEKSTSIDIRNFTIPLLWRYFQGAYRSGCDEIKVLFDSDMKNHEDAYHYYTSQFDYSELGEKVPPKPPIAMLQGLIDRFIGMGIIETGKGYCIIREMGEPTTKEFESSLRRIFLVLSHMFERVIEAIEKDEIKDVSFCKELHTIDLNVDRLVDYCSRIINKLNTSFPERKKILLFSTLFLLELMGDEFKYLGKHIALSEKSVKDALPLAMKIKEHFENYYRFFYKYDREGAIKFGKDDFEIYKNHFKIKDKLHGHSRSIARHFMMLSKFTLSLVELRIEMEF